MALLALISVAYFANGSESLVTLATQFFSKDILGLSPIGTQLVIGSLVWPWLPKFLYGFCTDSIPLAKYRRKPYLFLVCALSALSYATIGTFVSTVASLILFLVLSQFGAAFTDVIVDGLIVESSQGKSINIATHFQSLCVAANSVGVIVTSIAGGFMIQEIGPQETFFILAVLPILIMGSTCFVKEKPTPMKLELENIKAQAINLCYALKTPSIWKPCLFIFVMFAAPNADQGFFFFVTNGLGIEPSFMGFVTAATGFAGLIAALLFNYFCTHIHFKKMFLSVAILVTILGTLPLFLVFRVNESIGISDKLFLLSSKTITNIARNILRLVILVFAARVCPKNIEGTLFATIMGIWNFSGLVSDYFGALIQHALGVTENNFDKLWIAILISRILFLIPVFFISFLPDNLTGDSEEGDETDNDPNFIPLDDLKDD